MSRLDLDTVNTIGSTALHKAHEMKTAPLAVAVLDKECAVAGIEAAGLTADTGS